MTSPPRITRDHYPDLPRRTSAPAFASRRRRPGPVSARPDADETPTPGPSPRDAPGPSSASIFPTLAAPRGIPDSGRPGPAHLFACVIAVLLCSIILSGLRRALRAQIDSFRIDTPGIRFNDLIPWPRVTAIFFPRDSFTPDG